MPGARAQSRTSRWATTCHRRGDGRGLRRLRRRHRRPRRSGAPHDIVFEVVERRVEIKECPKCKGRFPDNIPCSTASASRPSSSTCWSPRCCPCAVLSRSCRRSPASSSPKPRLCFHDASWEEAAVAHLLQRPMSTISDQQQVASCRRDVQVPAPQARDRPVLQGRPGPRTWQCSHQRQPPAARTDLRRRGYRATDEEPAPCHKVNKSASKTLNDAGPCTSATAPSGRQGTARHPAAAERKTWTQVRRAQPARTSRETRKPALHRQPSR